jgi:hypothetical protein
MLIAFKLLVEAGNGVPNTEFPAEADSIAIDSMSISPFACPVDPHEAVDFTLHQNNRNPAANRIKAFKFFVRDISTPNTRLQKRQAICGLRCLGFFRRAGEMRGDRSEKM